jgi:chromosome segregation ATPase
MELSTQLKRTEFMLQNAKAIITNSEVTIANIKRNVENDEKLVSSLQSPISISNISENNLEEELIKIVNELEIANNTIDGNSSLIGELNEQIDGLTSKIYTLEDKLEEEKAKAQEYLV